MRDNEEEVESKETKPSMLASGHVPEAVSIKTSDDKPLDAELVKSTGNRFAAVRLGRRGAGAPPVYVNYQSDKAIPSKLLNSWIQSNLPTGQMNSIVDLATKTFEDAEYANEWLNRPNPATDDKPPIALLGTEHGFKRVETLIQRLAYGIVA